MGATVKGLTRSCALTAFLAAIGAKSSLGVTETLSVSFSTSTNSGAFTPQNYVAAWLEDANGDFVMTLGRHGNYFWYDLRDWQSGAGYDVDGLTGATRLDHALPVSYSADVTSVPDGDCEIELQMTEDEFPLPGVNRRATFAFVKDGSAATITPADQGGFGSITIDYSGRPGPGNYAPGVYAGPDLWVTMPSSANLNGAATDDSGSPSVSWSRITGTGTVGFGSPNSTVTTASFSLEGTYVLELTANDGSLASSDRTTVYVNALDITAEADAVVNSTLPSTNDGAWHTIWLNATNRAYVRFNLAGIPGEVSAAILRLATKEGGFTSFDYAVRPVTNDGWSEMGITWNNMPSAGSIIGAFATDPGWGESDVGPFVALQAAGDEEATLHLGPDVVPDAWVGICARESGYVPPTLRVTYNRLPAVTIDSPAGGASFDQGTNVSFSCTASDPDGTPLNYVWDSSRDGQLSTQASFSTTGLSIGNHAITLTATDASGGQGQDSISITIDVPPVPTVNVASPNGGESLFGGQNFTITWTSPDFSDNVKIEFYDGSSWSQVVGSTADDESHDWTVPNVDAAGCRIRISDAADGDPSDESDGVFTITASDGDALPDAWEMLYFSDLSQGPGDDPDLDGLDNLGEYVAGTDPTNPDTDGDGIEDGADGDPLLVPAPFLGFGGCGAAGAAAVLALLAAAWRRRPR